MASELWLRHVANLVPASLDVDRVAYALIPSVPRWTGDSNNPDIVIVTSRNELMEIGDRRVLRSCCVESESRAQTIRLHYHSAFGKAPNYILDYGDKLFIVGRPEPDRLEIVAKFNDVTRFELNDPDQCGSARLCLWCLDDVMPMILNDSYEVDSEETVFHEDEQPILSFLMGRLSEARLNTARNRKTLNERKLFRKEVLHALSENSRYDLDNVECKEKSVFDKVSIDDIWQRTYDGKWIIGIPVKNISDGRLKDLSVLIKCNSSDVPFNYETKTYVMNDKVPMQWSEASSEELLGSITIVVLAKEPKYDFDSYQTLNAALEYKYGDKLFTLPLPDITIKAIDVINGKYDPILNNTSNFESNDILSLYSCSFVKSLDIHFVDGLNINIRQLFTEVLGYNTKSSFQNVLVHSKSPIHILHGTSICIHESDKTVVKITVFSRSAHQLLMLINVMYDQLPKRIVIVPPEFDVKMKGSQRHTCDIFSEDMEITQEMNPQLKSNVDKFNSLLQEQMSLVTRYVDRCLRAMSESDAPKSDASMNINLLALGSEAYSEFWEKLDELNIAKNDLMNGIVSV